MFEWFVRIPSLTYTTDHMQELMSLCFTGRWTEGQTSPLSRVTHPEKGERERKREREREREHFSHGIWLPGSNSFYWSVEIEKPPGRHLCGSFSCWSVFDHSAHPWEMAHTLFLPRTAWNSSLFYMYLYHEVKGKTRFPLETHFSVSEERHSRVASWSFIRADIFKLY